MAEEELEAMFDPGMKKKKKKKTKTPFDLDAALEGGDTTTSSTPKEDDGNEEGQKENVVEEKPSKDIMDDLDLDDFSKLKKKKKKKKTGFDMDALGEALPDADAPAEAGTEETNDAPAVITNEIEDFDEDFTSLKKKKKKKRIKIIENLEGGENGEADENAENDDAKEKAGVPWAGSERDYTYDELLNRVFDIMRAKNPDMVTGEKKRFVMKPPQVVRVGTKKSSFVNFSDICKMLHRQPEHLLAFLLAELGTSGSIDGQNMLIIKGRFQQKQIESVLRRYIKEYVTCHTCRSSDTILHKENRLFFLQCESCQSRCSVASIKSGFQAVTSKRAQIRAKAN